MAMNDIKNIEFVSNTLTVNTDGKSYSFKPVKMVSRAETITIFDQFGSAYDFRLDNTLSTSGLYASFNAMYDAFLAMIRSTNA